MKKRQIRAETKYLFQLFIAVVVLGYWIFISYTRQPDLGIESLSARRLGSTHRIPASIPISKLVDSNQHNVIDPSSQDNTQTPSSMILEVDCNHLEIKPIKLTQRKIRFTGLCKDLIKKTENSKFSITNSTNGYTASLFTSKDKFITDFIDLSSGRNEIQFSRKSADGTIIVQTVQIDTEFEQLVSK